MPPERALTSSSSTCRTCCKTAPLRRHPHVERGIPNRRHPPGCRRRPEFRFYARPACLHNQLDPDLWLMGEVIHDHRQWANPAMLHATTNYELYKASIPRSTMAIFELAYSLNREFGSGGIYGRSHALQLRRQSTSAALPAASR